jgi:hypothetical protein
MLLLTLFLVPFFVRIPRSLNHHPIISPLGDQIHIVLFGGIALLLYWFGPLQGRIWPVALASTLLGGVVELLQLLVGRQALVKDFLLDIIGIGLVVCFIYWRGHGRQSAKVVFLLLLLTIPLQLYYLPWQISATYRARDMFPLLADFEHFGDRYLWTANQKGKMSFVEIPDSPSGPGRVFRVAGGPETDWPGGFMRRFPADWSGYTTLKMEVRLVKAPVDTFKFGVRLDDYEGIREVAWVSSPFYATRRWQTISMSITDRLLSNKKRDLNLKEMDRLIIHFARPADPVAIEVDNLRLE